MLVGPLITQTRSKGGVCDSIPYNIESIREHYRTGRTGAGSKPECASSQTTKVPFGFDATFSPTSELYRQTNVLEMTTMYRFYNRSNNNARFYRPSWEDDTWPADFASAMAFWNDNVPGRANALEGIWSDEVSLDTLVPYGFFWDSGAGSGDVYGYPVFFDINLNVSKTTDMFQSLVDGQYLDPDLTSLVTTTLLLFNPELGLFALVQVSASPDPTGGTDLSSDMALFDPDFYDFGHNAGDVWRVALEVFFTIVLIYLLKEECVELLERVQQGQAEGENVVKASLRYFTDLFNVLDLSSYIILAVAMFNWYYLDDARRVGSGMKLRPPLPSGTRSRTRTSTSGPSSSCASTCTRTARWASAACSSCRRRRRRTRSSCSTRRSASSTCGRTTCSSRASPS